MANSKISALTSATTPLAGTETLPVVQSSATVKVTVANLTPGLSTITAAKGGTGQTSYAVGDLIYADTTTTLAKLADVATGNALISGGVSTAPSWGKIGLATHVSGTLPVANGGTGVTSSTGTTNVVLSNSPSLLSPSISTTTTASGAVVSTLNGTGQNITANSTTYSVTFAYSAKVFYVSLGSGDAVLCIANYLSSVITILGTTTVIVNSSTPSSGQFGIYKSTNSHVVSFVTGSAATSAYGGWQVVCLSSTAA